jgi:pimeloyl-ACP methyl ester carboxylesterase
MGMFLAILIAIMAALASGRTHAAELTWPDADKARFSVEVTGSGPDVILVPGLGSSKAVWESTVAHLKSTHRLHVIQVAGFAGLPAGANAEGEMTKATVEALHDYLTANKLKPVYIGHSYGGLMGLMLANAHPDDLKSLIVVDALPFYAMVFNPSATVESVTPMAAQMRDGLAQSLDDSFKVGAQQSAARLVTRPDHQAMVTDWSMSSDRKVFAKAFYEDLTTDIRSILKTNKVKTLVLYPHSPATGYPVAATDAFYKSAFSDMPLLTLKRIDQSLHFIMLDQPQAFETAIDEALK